MSGKLIFPSVPLNPLPKITVKPLEQGHLTENEAGHLLCCARTRITKGMPPA